MCSGQRDQLDQRMRKNTKTSISLVLVWLMLSYPISAQMSSSQRSLPWLPYLMSLVTCFIECIALTPCAVILSVISLFVPCIPHWRKNTAKIIFAHFCSQVPNAHKEAGCMTQPLSKHLWSEQVWDCKRGWSRRWRVWNLDRIQKLRQNLT